MQSMQVAASDTIPNRLPVFHLPDSLQKGMCICLLEKHID